MGRRKVLNPLRIKKTRAVGVGPGNHLNGVSHPTGPTGPRRRAKRNRFELETDQPKIEPAPVIEPWRDKIEAFQDEELFQRYMDILAENRRELFPEEDLEE